MAEIPVSLLNDLQRIPRDRQVALLMRHSERYPILDPNQPYVALLTEEGVRQAEELGEILGSEFSPGRLMSAPVDRCRDTAEAIARGAGWPETVTAEDLFSHPFIAPAWDLLYRGEVNGTLPMQVRAALDLLTRCAEPLPALDIAVTHDTVLGTIVGCLLKAPVTGEDWPEFLEGVFIWREGSRVCFLWRGKEYRFAPDYRVREM